MVSVWNWLVKRFLFFLPYLLIAAAVVVIVLYLNNEAAQVTAGVYYDR